MVSYVPLNQCASPPESCGKVELAPFNVNLPAFTPGETRRVKNEIPEAWKYRAHRK
jgi:hypothetical protein